MLNQEQALLMWSDSFLPPIGIVSCRLHSKGIEVILDVVYNHTAEGSDVNPYILSHRCIDCRSYYQMKLDQYEQLLNYSGCGNSVNANNPATAKQIMDSLRMWVEDYHVDGFRFDLATCLCRGTACFLLLLEVVPCTESKFVRAVEATLVHTTSCSN